MKKYLKIAAIYFSIVVARLKNRCLGCVLGPNIRIKTFIRRSIKQTQTRACKPSCDAARQRAKTWLELRHKVANHFCDRKRLLVDIFAKYFVYKMSEALWRGYFVHIHVHLHPRHVNAIDLDSVEIFAISVIV